jgi:putative hemin transport protein
MKRKSGMSEAVTQSSSRSVDETPSELIGRWQFLKDEEPQLRARDAAARLGVSEAELVGARCGDGVKRLGGPWGDLIKALPGLETVMVLTRNEHAVHEKVGTFDKVSVFKSMGLVLDEDIDLRLFLDHWHYGYAVTEDTRSGIRQSLQFFDQDGTAIHKIYLRDDSNLQAYEVLVERHLDADQAPGQQVTALPLKKADRPDHEIDRALLRERWRGLQDVHDFHAMLHEVGAGRIQAFRLVGDEFAYRVDPNAFRLALEESASSEAPIMIFAGNPGVIQIHTGPVHKLRELGPWFNVLDDGFNLHLRADHIAEAWVIRKPTRDGIVTSLEIFADDECQIAWMFGKRKPGEAELEGWRDLVASFAPLGEPV